MSTPAFRCTNTKPNTKNLYKCHKYSNQNKYFWTYYYVLCPWTPVLLRLCCRQKGSLYVTQPSKRLQHLKKNESCAGHTKQSILKLRSHQLSIQSGGVTSQWMNKAVTQSINSPNLDRLPTSLPKPKSIDPYVKQSNSLLNIGQNSRVIANLLLDPLFICDLL